MRYANYIKIPNSPKPTQEQMDWAIKRVVYTGKKKAFDQSLKLFNPKIATGFDGGDFVHNLKTVLVRWTAFKMPRIAKRLIKFKP